MTSRAQPLVQHVLGVGQGRAARPLITAIAFVMASCDPAPVVDAHAFASALLDATTACEEPFLRQAEPIFFEAQLAAQKQVVEARFADNRANPHVTFSEGAYGACLAAAEAGDCTTLADDAGPCAQVFVGTLGPGDTCAQSVECGGNTSCFQARDACGDCRPAAGLGAGCADQNCGEGLYCTVALVCEPEPSPATFADGDPCNTTVGCGGVTTGLSCVDGLCARIIVVGRGRVRLAVHVFQPCGYRQKPFAHGLLQNLAAQVLRCGQHVDGVGQAVPPGEFIRFM